MRCPSCSFFNSPGMKYCGQCGAKLEEKEFGERRIATVMFVDLSGYTRLSETVDPEEVKEILETIFSVVAEGVKKYSGNVNKLIGDCAMCVFGFPTAVENHPEKALLSLLLIYETIDEIFRYSSYPIKLHTGVDTGLVVVEQMGSDKTSEYSIMGDTVNLASRLQTIAHPGEMLVSHTVWKRTKNIFNFEELGVVDIKGKKEPIKTFRLIDKRVKRGKIRGIKGVQAPMVGRRQELAMMQNSIRNYMEKKNDTAVLITGEPGIGKSRLYKELKGGFKNVTFLEGRALPYEADPFYPLVAILKNLIEIKGKNVFKQMFPDGKVGLLPVKPFIDLILTGEVPSGLKTTPPEKLKQQKFFILEVILRKICVQEPIVLSFEDLHWADEETLEFLEYLFSGVKAGSGIFAIFILRPPVKAERLLKFFRYIRNLDSTIFIRIDHLTYRECKELTSKLLEIELLPEEMKRELIYSKSEGNPFFIEELIKVLIEKGVLVRKGKNWLLNDDIERIPELPSSIEEVMLELVDKLDEKERRFLRAASVIGKTFFKEGVERLLNLDDSEKEFNSLLKLKFIQPADSKFLNFPEYEFRHNLLQDAIYNSLLKKHRKYFHLDFAVWLEGLLGEYPDDIPYTMLADYFELGGDLKKAFIYNHRAADRYKDNYANFEALRRFKKAISLIEQIPEFSEKLPELLFALGSIYFRLSENQLAIDTLDKAFNLAKVDRLKCRIFLKMGDVYQKTSDYSQAYTYYSLAEGVAKDDAFEKLSIAMSKAWLYYVEGNMNEYKKLIDEARSIFETLEFDNEKERLRRLADLEKRYGTYYGDTGNISECLEHYTHSLGIYEKLDDLSGKSAIYNNMGIMLQKVGKISEGAEAQLRSLEIDKNTGDYFGYAVSCGNTGENYTFFNRLNKAEDYFNEYLSVNKKINNRLGDGYAIAGLAEVHRMKKEKESARDSYEKSIEIFENVGSEIMKKTTEVRLGDFHIENGENEKGFRLLESVLPYAKKHSIFELLIDLHLGYAKYYINQHKKGAGKDSLDKCKMHLETIEELFLRKSEDIIALLEWAKLNLRYNRLRNDKELVEKSKNKVKITLNKVIEGITDEDDRKSFLAREDIQQLKQEIS